jgi:hypothetical protein
MGEFMSMDIPGNWSELSFSPELLKDGVQAPIPLPVADASTYGDVIGKLLAGTQLGDGTIRAAMSSAVSLLCGAQDFLRLANSLIERSVSISAAREIAWDMLRNFHALVAVRAASYVLVQVAEVLTLQSGDEASGPAMERIPRWKNYMTPLEDRLGELEIPKHMEAPRVAALLVHLDDMYDDSSVQVQRICRISSRPIDEARLLLAEFLGNLFQQFARASFADHLLAEHDGKLPAEERSGLLGLMPEFLRILEARGAG